MTSPVTAVGLLLLVGLSWWCFRQNRALRHLKASGENQIRDLRNELSHQQKRYEQLLDNANDGLLFIDLETGQLLGANHRAEELTGYSLDEIEQFTLKTLFPRPYRHRFWRLVATVKRQDVALEEELQFRRKDGTLFIGAVQVRAGWLGDRRVAQRHVVATGHPP